MFVRKLVLSNLFARKTRAALTVAAVALSVSLVVAVTSGYASVVHAVHHFLDKYMGSVDAEVSRQGDPRGTISEKILDMLKHDPAVRRADGRVELTDPIIDKNGQGVDGRSVDVIGIDRPSDTRVDTMTMEKGQFFNEPEGNVTVIDQALAERLKEGPGDEVSIPRPESSARLKLKIVGVVHKPEIMAAAMQTMYVPMRTLQKFLGWDRSPDGSPVGRLNRISIEFKQGVDGKAFAQRVEPLIREIDPTARLNLTRDTRAELDKELSTIDLLSYMGGTVSMLAATFIVFSALSMGVTERQRTLAMLRAVGAYRGQIGSLVVVEGVLLATAGVVIGVPLGWLWVKILSLIFRDVFSAGVVLSLGGVAFGSVGSILAALAASILPAWWATRVSPLEAMTPEAAPPSRRAPVWAGVCGLILVSIDPFLFFGPLHQIVGLFHFRDPEHAVKVVQFYGHFALGLPGIMFGFFLLAPVLVMLAERVLGPVIAFVFRLNGRLVRQQLSGGLWRAAGTASALMVGLAVLVAMEVQGNSALQGWKLPDKFPDIFVVSTIGDVLKRGGLSFEQVETLKKIPGVKQDEIMPIAIASPQFATKVFSFALAAMDPDATMFLGVDPKLAFKMMQLEFRQGSEADAQRVLTCGKEVTLTDGRSLRGSVREQGDAFLVTDVWGKTQSVPKSQVARVPRGGYQSLTLKNGLVVTGSVSPAEPGMLSSGEPEAASEPAKPKGLGSLLNPLKWGIGRRPTSGPATNPDTQPAAPPADLEVEALDDNSKLTPIRSADLAKPPADGYAIAHGRFLIVTNEFREVKHLGVGDDFPLKDTHDHVVHYTICGVVWSPGIDVMVSVFDMGRQFSQRTAASVFGTVEDARRDFGTEHIYLFAANLQPGIEREQIMKEIKKAIRIEGMRAGDVRHIKALIQQGFYRLLHLASVVAYAAMAVASLGVTNTVMAGIRTRRWQFGVLRSIGVTRSQLLRLVLSEAGMLGAVACVMGLSAGALIAKDAYQLSLNNTGYNPGISVPWLVVLSGVGVVLLISMAASLWPAVHVSRTQPLDLLQAGRAST